MKIGVDGRKIPEAVKRGPRGSLDHARALGLDGLFFRTVFEMSPKLDPGEMRAVRERADALDLYLETGLGKVNPFATPEAPELRRAGDGDIVLGFRRMMERCAEIGCRELWVGTANYQPDYNGHFRYDRFRTDASWNDQLAATRVFLDKLAPIARDLGIHLNMETHEEITSFEVVRMVEAVGPDVLGIVFDTANVLQRAEHPVRAARRVAPYVRQTHMKDALLEREADAVVFQLRACGTGVVDFGAIVPMLATANPSVNLTIENAQSNADRTRPFPAIHIDVFDPEWLAGHPDLDAEEMEAFLELVRACQTRINSGEVESAAVYGAAPFGFDEAVAAILQSAEHLRIICAGLESKGVSGPP